MYTIGVVYVKTLLCFSALKIVLDESPTMGMHTAFLPIIEHSYFVLFIYEVKWALKRLLHCIGMEHGVRSTKFIRLLRSLHI